MTDRASHDGVRPRPVSPSGRAASLDGDPDRGAAGEALEAVRHALQTIEFGSVLIKIHQGTVVGIETSTKLRLRGT